MTGVEITARSVCGAQRRAKEGGRCTRPAGWGTSHLGIGCCKLHGGSTRNHDIAAARAKLAQIAAYVEASAVVPEAALRLCVRLAVREVLYASEQVAALPESAIEHSGRLHPWIVVRQQAVDLLARVAKMALDAGVVEREASVARLSGEQVAFGGALGSLVESDAAVRSAAYRRRIEAARDGDTAEYGSER
jgi:hypothetical protein